MKFHLKIASVLTVTLPILTCSAAYVNNQITDAVSQTNVKVVAEAPAQAMSNIYISLSKSNGLLLNNNCIIQNNGSLPVHLSQNMTLQPQETISQPCQSPELLRNKLKQQNR